MSLTGRKWGWGCESATGVVVPDLWSALGCAHRVVPSAVGGGAVSGEEIPGLVLDPTPAPAGAGWGRRSWGRSDCESGPVFWGGLLSGWRRVGLVGLSPV